MLVTGHLRTECSFGYECGRCQGAPATPTPGVAFPWSPPRERDTRRRVEPQRRWCRPRPMDLTRPFHGATAVRAGLVTPNELRGPRFRRLVRGVHVRVDVPVTYLLRCEAVALTVGALAATGRPRPGDARTALAGWAAAEVHDARCAPQGVPVEIAVPGGNRRLDGVLVHRGLLAPDELVAGVRIPAPVAIGPGSSPAGRSRPPPAAHRLRPGPPGAAHGSGDRPRRTGPGRRFRPGRRARSRRAVSGSAGIRRLPGLVALSDPLAGSPMKTRVRLALHDGGLPPPSCSARSVPTRSTSPTRG